MATLEEDMLAQAAPQQAVPQEMAGAQSPVNLRDALSPLASDPSEQFLVAMMLILLLPLVVMLLVVLVALVLMLVVVSVVLLTLLHHFKIEKLHLWHR